VSSLITVVVADDQALLRGTFRLLIDSAADLTTIGEAGTGTEAVDLARREHPDVILMDIRMPQLAALRAGASGFLLKDTPPADLLNAIRTVAGGEALLAPTVTRRLITEFARRPRPAQAPAPELAAITEREREVLTLVGQGLTNHEISEHLHISLATTRTHVGHLLTKLNARDRAQLVIAAYETGLVIARPHQP
jgi:DNA-binding NarL/FixJ family response regulator